MNECLNCGKEVVQKEGRRKRLYCSDTCRVKFNRQKHGKKVRWVSVEKYNELLERVSKNNEPENKASIMEQRNPPTAKSKYQNPITEMDAYSKTDLSLPLTDDALKLAEYEAELPNVPENTSLGKVRRKFLERRIKELKQQLN